MPVKFNPVFFEDVLFEYTYRIHAFNDYLTQRYDLSDIPYNVSGKAFPKTGEVKIGEYIIQYRFHGRGATLFWNEAEIKFDIDAVSRHKILTSAWPYQKFLSRFIDGFDETTYSLPFIGQLLLRFEEKGMLMREANGYVYHISEDWYKQRHAILKNPSTGQ